MSRIAVLGSTSTGAQIAERLARAGHHVRTHGLADVAPEIHAMDTPQAAVEDADVVCTHFVDASAMLAVMPTALCSLPRSAWWLQLTDTPHAFEASRVRALAATASIAYAHAPVQCQGYSHIITVADTPEADMARAMCVLLTEIADEIHWPSEEASVVTSALRAHTALSVLAAWYGEDALPAEFSGALTEPLHSRTPIAEFDIAYSHWLHLGEPA